MEFMILASSHFLALLSPGPDFFIIMQTALKEDINKALKVCIGIASANALYISFAVSGFEIIRDFSVVLETLKYLGGGYLLYIGYLLLKTKKIDLELQEATRTSQQNFFLLGFLSAFLNPKNIIFYFSLFVVMVSPQTSLHVKILYGIWMSCAVLFWDVCIVYLVGNKRVKDRLNAYIYYIEKAAGSVLIIFGATLMF